MNADPLSQIAGWWRDAQPPAVVATATPDGRPSARAVVLEGFDERGFVFYTSAESRKGRELAANPRAALVVLWPGRQARVEGRVERVSDADADAHWAGRRGKRQLAAFAQGEPAASREELEARIRAVPDDPPRPDFWVGYRIVPEAIELWQADEDYVHDRFRYRRAEDGWLRERLQP